MSALEMSSVSGTSFEIEDEEIDVDSDPSPIDTDFHRHPHQQHPHPRGHKLQKPSCSPHLRLSFADRPSLQQSMESEDRIRKRSSDKAIAQSAPKLKSHSKHVPCSTTELQSLLSTTAEDPIISSDKRFFGSPPSVVDRSPSSGVSSSSSSSSAASSPPSSPHHQKHHLPPTTVPSLVSPSSLSSTKSGDAFQQSRLSCPSNPSAVVVPRSAPAPVTNFFIEEILKPSFGVSSSKSVQVPTWFRSTWVRGGSQVLSPDLIKRNELPPRSGLLLQKYEHFPISSIQETKEAHMTKKRKQSKLSQNSYLRHRVDLERNDPKLPPRVIGDLNTRNTGVPYKVQSPDSKSSTRYQALPLLDQSESGAFKLVTCSLASAPNDCSNSNSSSSSSGSSQTSGSLPEEGRRSEDSDQPLHLSDPSSASSGSSSSCFQSQQLPAWVYCTRYSDRPSSGPRSRKVRTRTDSADDKRPRTAFTNDQLQILKREFSANQYLNEDRRNALAAKLNLNETQIKIWFQNKRAKLKKTSGTRNRLALELMAQGLYNHSTVSVTGECG